MSTINTVGNGLFGATGSGSFVGSNTPTLVTPVLGAATATSINFGGSTLNTYAGFTSWTPVFTFATPGNLTVSYASQIGWYSRIGNIVVIGFNLTCTPTYTTASGNLQITGMPFPTNSSSGNTTAACLISSSNAWPTVGTQANILIGANSSIITLYAAGSSNGGGNFTTSNALTATQIIIDATFIYSV